MYEALVTELNTKRSELLCDLARERAAGRAGERERQRLAEAAAAQGADLARERERNERLTALLRTVGQVCVCMQAYTHRPGVGGWMGRGKRRMKGFNGMSGVSSPALLPSILTCLVLLRMWGAYLIFY